MAEKKDRYMLLDDEPFVFDTWVSYDGSRAYIEFMDVPADHARKKVKIYVDEYMLAGVVRFFGEVLAQREEHVLNMRRRAMRDMGE